MALYQFLVACILLLLANVYADDNILLNGGFESGPAFLNSEPILNESALPQWTVFGAVKYINVKYHHFVPEGKAAIEIVSAGNSSGIETATQIKQSKIHILEFFLGDANDSCFGNFTVGVAAGKYEQNFTILSFGNGSARRQKMPFTGADDPQGAATTIRFQSYNVKQRNDGVFCGPVLDGVVLRAARVCKLNVHLALSIVSFIFVAALVVF